MKNTDGIPRRAILVMAAILVSVILGAQASTRSIHQIFSPTNPLAIFTKNVSDNDRKLASAKNNTSNTPRKSGPAASVFSQSNDALIHKSGSITDKQVWGSGKTYYIENAIDIEDGGSLTLEPGVIVKVGRDQTGFMVHGGGSFFANGTSDKRITITSSFDSTDRTTPDFGPNAGDYKSAIIAGRSANVALANTTISYADTGAVLYGQSTFSHVQMSNTTTAIEVNDGNALLTDMTVADTVRGLDVGGGIVAYRGTFTGIHDMAIRACVWGSDACAVDASYTNWASIDGPLTKVCGQVQTLPWRFNNAAVSNQSLFAGNCDSSPSPDVQVASSIDSFLQRRAARDADCGNGSEDACTVNSSALACLQTMLQGAAGSAPYAFPIVGSNGEGIDTFYGTLSDATHQYLINQAIENPTSVTAASLAYSGYAKNVYGAVAAAFNSCAP